jgi:hypothetical protein
MRDVGSSLRRLVPPQRILLTAAGSLIIGATFLISPQYGGNSVLLSEYQAPTVSTLLPYSTPTFTHLSFLYSVADLLQVLYLG